MSSIRLGVLTTCIAVLLMVGCGSSGTTNGGNASKASSGGTTDNGNGTVVSLTRTDLTTKSNAICERVHRQLLTLGKIEGKSPEQIFSLATSYEQQALIDLEKFSPPAELADDWKQILTAMRTLAADSKRYVEYAKVKEMSNANGLAESYSPIKLRGIAVARHDGLDQCALAL